VTVVAVGTLECGDGGMDVFAVSDEVIVAGKASIADGFLAREESFCGSVGVVAVEAFAFGDRLVKMFRTINIDMTISAHSGIGAFVAEDVFFYIFVLVARGAGADCGWAVEEAFVDLIGVAAGGCAIGYFDCGWDIGLEVFEYFGWGWFCWDI